MKLTRRHRRILEFCKNNPRCQCASIEAHCRDWPDELASVLMDVLSAGLLAREEGMIFSPAQYSITSEGEAALTRLDAQRAHAQGKSLKEIKQTPTSALF